MKLTAEQLKLAQECTSAEELVDKAKNEGIDIAPEFARDFLNARLNQDLATEDLDTVAGGCNSSYMKCKICGNEIVSLNYWAPDLNGQICHPCFLTYYTEDNSGVLHRK